MKKVFLNKVCTECFTVTWTAALSACPGTALPGKTAPKQPASPSPNKSSPPPLPSQWRQHLCVVVLWHSMQVRAMTWAAAERGTNQQRSPKSYPCGSFHCQSWVIFSSWVPAGLNGL
eukprot:1138770-Pelagomonas_calceolata.AAC.6